MAIRLPPYIPPGSYTAQLAVIDGEGAQLGAWAADGGFQGVRVTLGEVEIAPPVEPPGIADCTPYQGHEAGPLIACLGESPPETVPSGDTFTLSIVWSAAETPSGDYGVRWRLLDTARSTALEHTEPLSPHPTSRWRSGDSYRSRYGLNVDPAVPAGEYTVALNVLDPEGDPVWAEDIPVTTIEILHRERRFVLPNDIAHPLDLTLGDVIHLRGYDLPTTQASPGGTLPLTLYWQGDGPTDIDYTVFVHLVGPEGQNHGQLDYHPGGGPAPTTSWAPGQAIIDDLALPVDGDAPQGTYTIAVGMYDPKRGGRLPITDASGQRLPGDRAPLPFEIAIDQ